VAETWKLMEKDEWLTMEKYMVYCHLRKLGYVVRRYLPQTKDEKEKRSELHEERKKETPSKSSAVSVATVEEKMENRKDGDEKRKEERKCRRWWPNELGNLEKKLQYPCKIEITKEEKRWNGVESYGQLKMFPKHCPDEERAGKARDDGRHVLSFEVFLMQGYSKKQAVPKWRLCVCRYCF
jgi:hypothetical protein